MFRCSFVRRTLLSSMLVAGCTASQPAVEQIGAMREVMRDGRSEPRISVADAVARPRAIGVGALEGLSGEITIIDGSVWISRVDGDRLRITGPEPRAGDQATLLTLSHVARWQSVAINEEAEGQELESIIADTARQQGLDVETPFPFVLSGMLAGLELHVINGWCPTGSSPVELGQEPWRWSSTVPIEATVVGFFAPNAAGVMTHHGTAIHAHAIVTLDGRTITAHVDRMVVAPGVTLRVPGTGREEQDGSGPMHPSIKDSASRVSPPGDPGGTASPAEPGSILTAWQRHSRSQR